VTVRWLHEQDDEVSEELGRELTADLHFINVSSESLSAGAGLAV